MFGYPNSLSVGMKKGRSVFDRLGRRNKVCQVDLGREDLLKNGKIPSKKEWLDNQYAILSEEYNRLVRKHMTGFGWLRHPFVKCRTEKRKRNETVTSESLCLSSQTDSAEDKNIVLTQGDDKELVVKTELRTKIDGETDDSVPKTEPNTSPDETIFQKLEDKFTVVVDNPENMEMFTSNTLDIKNYMQIDNSNTIKPEVTGNVHLLNCNDSESGKIIPMSPERTVLPQVKSRVLLVRKITCKLDKNEITINDSVIKSEYYNTQEQLVKNDSNIGNENNSTDFVGLSEKQSHGPLEMKDKNSQTNRRILKRKYPSSPETINAKRIKMSKSDFKPNLEINEEINHKSMYIKEEEKALETVIAEKIVKLKEIKHEDYDSSSDNEMKQHPNRRLELEIPSSKVIEIKTQKPTLSSVVVLKRKPKASKMWTDLLKSPSQEELNPVEFSKRPRKCSNESDFELELAKLKVSVIKNKKNIFVTSCFGKRVVFDSRYYHDRKQ